MTQLFCGIWSVKKENTWSKTNIKQNTSFKIRRVNQTYQRVNKMIEICHVFRLCFKVMTHKMIYRLQNQAYRGTSSWIKTSRFCSRLDCCHSNWALGSGVKLLADVSVCVWQDVTSSRWPPASADSVIMVHEVEPTAQVTCHRLRMSPVPPFELCSPVKTGNSELQADVLCRSARKLSGNHW